MNEGLIFGAIGAVCALGGMVFTLLGFMLTFAAKWGAETERRRTDGERITSHETKLARHDSHISELREKSAAHHERLDSIHEDK